MKKNQQGFGAIEGLLITILIVLIGGVGFYVYSVNQESTKQQADSSIKQQENKPAEQHNQYFEFKEMGVKIKKTATLKEPVYFTIPELSSESEQAIFVSTTELVSTLQACNPGTELEDSYKSAMSISKRPGKYPDVPTGLVGTLIKQFDNFYLSFNTGGSQLCSDTASNEASLKASTLLESVRKDYTVGFKSAELIQ